MNRVLGWFSAVLLVACNGTGKLPFNDDELEPRDDPPPAGRGGSGGSAGFAGGGRGGTSGSAGRGGTAGSAGRGGMGGSSGRGGSGGAPACDTKVSFSDATCNTCMQRYCCDALERCTSDDCLTVEDCADEAGCFEGSSSSFSTCVQRFCRVYGEEAVYTYLETYQCFSGECSDACN